MKALEADIAQAESSRTERTMSVKYHKVKFFGEFDKLLGPLVVVSWLSRTPEGGPQDITSDKETIFR